MADDPARANVGEIALVLGLTVVGQLAGGEFGATLVRDGAARELVLKTSSAALHDRFAQGADMAGRVWAIGYPAPRYEGTGVVGRVCWSLQERLPGAVPEVMTALHARQLLDLAELHSDAAGRSGEWLPAAMSDAGAAAERLMRQSQTAAFAGQLMTIVAACEGLAVREADVVHGDFHHRNFLADGERVTGVFDWELAAPGDWRSDLVTFAYWSQLVPEQWAPDAAAFAVARMQETVPAELIALFVAMRSLNVLDFYARVRPEAVPSAAAAIEARILPWCSTVL